MSLEERMLERFTRERQRASKAVVFNLQEEEELTHYGRSLSKLDDFDEAGLGMDQDEEEEGSESLSYVVGRTLITLQVEKSRAKWSAGRILVDSMMTRMKMTATKKMMMM